MLGLLAKHRASAIHRRRGGVDELDFLFHAVIEQVARVAIVVLHHEAAIALGGVRASALMQHRADHTVEGAVFQLLHEVFPIEIISNLTIDQIVKFVALLQIIHGNDFIATAIGQRFDDIGADESGCTGHNDIHGMGTRQSGQRVENNTAGKG